MRTKHTRADIDNIEAIETIERIKMWLDDIEEKGKNGEIRITKPQLNVKIIFDEWTNKMVGKNAEIGMTIYYLKGENK